MVLCHIPAPRRNCTYTPVGQLSYILYEQTQAPSASQLYLPVVCIVFICAHTLHLMPRLFLLSWNLLFQSEFVLYVSQISEAKNNSTKFS